MKLLFALILLALVPAAAAQNVPLQLWDHVVDGEILHNRVLPPGTEVWIVTKSEARAVRLREGYGEVTPLLPGATRDRVGADGRTEGSYPRTARAGEAYYVVARLPDGRLFQSYVKTGDAGMQPGFDDVQTGRISMGQVPPAAAAQIGAVLTSTLPEPPATHNAAGPPVTVPEARTPDSLGADHVALPAFAAAPFDTTEPAPVPMIEADDEIVYADEPEENRASRGWLWLLGGLLLGAAGTYFGTAVYYERLLRQQRENMLRYVPAIDADAALSREGAAAETGDAPPFLPSTVAALAAQQAPPEDDEAADDRG